MKYTLLSPVEKKIVFDMYRLRKIKPSKIAEALGRNKSTITRHLFKKISVEKVGRKKLLTKPMVDRLIKVLHALVKKAKGEIEVTAAMLKKAAKCQASVKTILKELHARKVYFRAMRQKPVLTAEDVQARYAFAQKYKGKSAKWWNEEVHAFIDNKHWPVYLSANARALAARRTVRGVFRAPGEGLGQGYVKNPDKLKVNTGGKSSLIGGGIGGGKVFLWDCIEGKWNGKAAAKLYQGPLLTGLKAARPKAKKHRILEDNDPSGYKSTAGINAKAAVKIEVLEIPKRSPDLNPMDYGLWKEVDTRMRRQEKKFKKNKKETRKEHLIRLKRTAQRLSTSTVTRLIGDMHRRCQRLFKAKGGHFEEGGKRTKAEMGH